MVIFGGYVECGRLNTTTMMMMVILLVVVVLSMMQPADAGPRRGRRRNKQKRQPHLEQTNCISCDPTNCPQGYTHTVPPTCQSILCRERCPPGYHDNTGNNSINTSSCSGKGQNNYTSTTTVMTTPIITTTSVTTGGTNTTIVDVTTIPPTREPTQQSKVVYPERHGAHMRKRRSSELLDANDEVGKETSVTVQENSRLQYRDTVSAYLHKCVPCAVKDCQKCPESRNDCKECFKGLIIQDGKCVPLDSDADDEDGGIGIALIVGIVLIIAVALVAVVVVTVLYCRKKQKNKVEFSGGCSVNLMTTERIPNSVRESMSHIYCNHVSPDDCEYLEPAQATQAVRKPSGGEEGKHPSKTETPASEMKEIDALPDAPTPPGNPNAQLYDSPNLEAPETPQVYLPVAFQNSSNIYQNTNVVLYENLQPPNKKEKPQRSQNKHIKSKQSEAQKEAKDNKEREKRNLQHTDQDEDDEQNGAALYVNTAQINNIVHNKNCTIKITQPEEPSSSISESCECSYSNVDADDECPSEESTTNQEYVLVPPSYDASVNGTNLQSGRSTPKRGSKRSQRGEGEEGQAGNSTVNTPNHNSPGLKIKSGKTEHVASRTVSNNFRSIPQRKGDVQDDDGENVYEEADSGAVVYAVNAENDNVYSEAITDHRVYDQVG